MEIRFTDAELDLLSQNNFYTEVDFAVLENISFQNHSQGNNYVPPHLYFNQIQEEQKSNFEYFYKIHDLEVVILIFHRLLMLKFLLKFQHQFQNQNFLINIIVKTLYAQYVDQ